jgi:UDP-N-acetylmuramoyl-tripeptide--D-alanyl-D-alanine ligase
MWSEKMIEIAKENLTIADILAATGGDLLRGSESTAFSGVSIDSRTIGQGELFWTLKGDRFDGHTFVNEVIIKGAAGAIVGPEFMPALTPAPGMSWPTDRVLIRVKDRLLALQETAGFLRRQFPIPVVAVTGSNGKTTTKEMIASIMSCSKKGEGRRVKSEEFHHSPFTLHTSSKEVLKTVGNQNNLIGLPLTLCKLSSEVKMAVLELGMNAFGEIRRLTQICQPTVGLITNIGPAHIEFFGSLEKISQAKGELFEEMRPDGVAIINGDDPYCLRMANRRGKVITFGLREGADVRGEGIRQHETNVSFTLHADGKKIEITLPLVGQINVYNALAAAAAARAIHVPLSVIRQGLEQVVLPPMRMMRLKGWNNSIIINDAYNANPVSMCSAIDTLVQSKADLSIERGDNATQREGDETGRGKKGEKGRHLPPGPLFPQSAGLPVPPQSLKEGAHFAASVGGRAILVLGDMLELGADAERFHRYVGWFIALSHIDYLFTCGHLAHWIAEEALANGMEKDHVFPDLNHDRIAETLKTLAAPGDRILIKGSRGARMETVAKILMDEK